MAEADATTILTRQRESLPVKLTQTEVREFGVRLAQMAGAIDMHGDREKEVKSQLKAERTKLEAEHQRLASVVRSGYENRNVDTITYAHHDEGYAITLRADNDDELRRRRLDDADQQVALPFDGERDPDDED